jgi:hypothetical protein
MKIVGLNILKILAERKEELETKIEIKQGIHLGEIISFESLSKRELAKLEFTSTIEYSKCAKLEIKGQLIVSPEKEELKEILKLQKEKKLTPELKVSLINFIMARCSLRLLELENELGLPFHIPLPKIVPQEE